MAVVLGLTVKNSVWFGTDVHGPRTDGADSRRPPVGPVHWIITELPLSWSGSSVHGPAADGEKTVMASMPFLKQSTVPMVTVFVVVTPALTVTLNEQVSTLPQASVAVE